MVIQADGVADEPAPGSRPARAMRVWDAQESGRLTDAEAYLQICDLMREAIAEAEAEAED